MSEKSLKTRWGDLIKSFEDIPKTLADLPKSFEDLCNEIKGDATDAFLVILLNGMKMAFYSSKTIHFPPDFYKNIDNFKAVYVFRSASGDVDATAIFADGDMKVKDTAVEHDWTVRVTFKNSQALRDFLFSKNQDILDSLLKNEVTAEGNLNYIYKFGFMARNLLHGLHLA